MRNCKGCGTEYLPTQNRQTRCTPRCGYTRPPRTNRATRAQTTTGFIGVDGEGITYPTGRILSCDRKHETDVCLRCNNTGSYAEQQHDYVLLSVGGISLHRDGERLTHVDIFPFLWRQHVLNPKACFVGFYLSYDFAQWIRAFPEERARMLLTPGGRASRMPSSKINPTPYPVRFAGWEFDFLGMRRFKLRPDNNSEAPWMYICDAGPFFQCSFLTAIDPKTWPEPICTDGEYALILEGKQSRSTAVFDQKMIQYNVTENTVLARAMTRIDEGFRAQGWNLRNSQWFGPGQAAGLYLKAINAPKGADVQEVTPDEVIQAAIASYYGGWFEIPCHGLIPGTSYEYDINSAYPHIIATLPCLLHGSWEPGWSGDYSLVKVDTRGSNAYLGGLPHRDSQGIISRPRNVTGWYWLSEVESAKRAGLIDTYGILESWTYHPCDCPPPLANVTELYDYRLSVGKNSPHGRGCRLVYNSEYGKFAQSVGNPMYANPLYASMITSGCRTMCLDAIGTHPNGAEHVLMVATDGVYFRSRHPHLPLSSTVLGSWDEGTKENLCLFMPGVYWDDKSRNALSSGDASIPIKSRGINARELANHIAAIDVDFASLAESGTIGTVWPATVVPVQFTVIGPNLALARNKWRTCGSIVTDGSKTLSSDPSNKRDTTRTYLDSTGIIRTRPHATRGDNYGYTKRFGMDLATIAEDEREMTDDGNLNREIYELLGGGTDGNENML